MILYFLSTKLRPFHNVLTNFETVIYLAAAKYGTVSPYISQKSKRSHILQLQNLRPFRHVKNQNTCLDKFETVPYFAAAKFETVSPSQKSNPTWCQNLYGPIFCSCKIWDRFTMSHQKLKRSHILQPQNLRPFCHVRTKIEMVPGGKNQNSPIFSSRVSGLFQ